MKTFLIISAIIALMIIKVYYALNEAVIPVYNPDELTYWQYK